MDKKTSKILIVLGIVLVVFAVVFFIKQTMVNESANTTDVTFTDPVSSAEIQVLFDQENDKATLSGLGYQNLVLDIAIAASGARYVNESEGVELWNRGNEVTVSKDGERIFSGNVGGLTDANKLSGTWIWQATTIGEVITEPNRVDAFTITFDEVAGRAHGTTDCNGFNGSYSVKEDDSLTFGPMASTMMYCEGSQENEFTSALAKTERFSFAGSGALVLELQGGGTMLFGK